jgi:MarR family transcriptional regulator, lower aerobic nicotinate degradation pathway regulator
MGSHGSGTRAKDDLAATAEVQAILEALRRIVQVLRVTSRTAERRHGVSAAQLFVLHVLALDGSVSVNGLAQRTLTHQSSVSVVVARLAAAGLVRRSRSRSDRRRIEVTLTERGRSVLRRVPEPAQAHLFAALSSMPAAERRALAHGLGTLVQGMGISDGVAEMFFEDHPGAGSPRRARRP